MSTIKRLIVHDVDLGVKVAEVSSEDRYVNASQEGIRSCKGCFSCWVRTPGICIIDDQIQGFAGWLSESDEFVILSRCTYGGYSPQIKNVFDRSIGFLLPYFTIRQDKRMHHLIRVEKPRELRVLFYGDISERERKTAEKIVKANAINLNVASHRVSFYTSAEEAIRELP